MSSLHDFLDEQEEVEKKSFAVKDDSSANWALRKIKQMNDQVEQNNALALAEIDKIEQWNQSENERAQQSIDYFQGLLAEYAMRKKEEDPKFKSLKLPNGRIGFRKQQPKWNYHEETVLQALKQANLTDFINVKETPKKADIKKAFEVSDGQVINPDTGEILKGVTIEERPDNFNVAVEK
jgi:phage host-nuclease inhibitor protein Gam